MKPVLSKTFGKNGDVIETFTPTARQILFALAMAKSPHLVEEEIAAEIGLSKTTLKTWKEKYGTKWQNWLEEMLDQHAPDKDAELLKSVGMIHALQGNYQFWKDLAKTAGVIKEDAKPLHVTINTDFSHIALGDFNEERARLLSELRSVGKSGKPGVAEPLTIDVTPGREGERNRTRKVQV